MTRRSPAIHERFLRHIWSKKYLTAELFTTDGKRLDIRNPGRLNTLAGPDFLDARILIDGTLYRGDVEIHRTVFEWLQHKHQDDPRYNRVILHVVLEAEKNEEQTLTHSGRTVPVLVLSRHLSLPLRNIWEKAILDERKERSVLSHCAVRSKELSPHLFEEWVSHLALERLELKLRRFNERLQELAFERKNRLCDHKALYQLLPSEDELQNIPPARYSLTKHDVSQKELWEQLLYEGWMEALGYAHNREAFLRLARALPLQMLREHLLRDTAFPLTAMLFGVAGLLPESPDGNDEEARMLVETLRAQWTKIRSTYRGDCLSRTDWVFFPTRPVNFPQRRLIAAEQLIRRMCSEDVFRGIIQNFKESSNSTDLQVELRKIFSVEVPSFWKQRYTFFQRSPKPLPALGNTRVHEIVVNVVLPVALLYARLFKESVIRQSVIALYKTLPARENNSILRVMKKEVLRATISLDSVCKQQGVIQLYKYYCMEKRCAECRLSGSL